MKINKWYYTYTQVNWTRKFSDIVSCIKNKFLIQIIFINMFVFTSKQEIHHWINKQNQISARFSVRFLGKAYTIKT